LTDFVGQQLQLDVQRLDAFKGLDGAAVLSNPVFKEHQVAFGTAYGLALQAAKAAAIGTNLLPDEIVRDRIIESKKPSAVMALVGLLAAALISYGGMYAAWTAYTPDLYAAAFGKAEAVKKQSAAATSAIGQVRERQTAAIAQQQWLAEVQNRRFETLDMLRAVQALLPRDEGDTVPENPADRRELHIDRMDCQYFPDLAVWFGTVQQQWAETHIGEDAAADEQAAAPDAAGQSAPQDGEAAGTQEPPGDGAAVEDGQAKKKKELSAPVGAGWVVELRGYHFHNEDRHKPSEGAQFLRDTLVKNLMDDEARLVVSAGPLAGEEVSLSELGIGYPVIIESSSLKRVRLPVASPSQGVQLPPAGPPRPEVPEASEQQELWVKRYDFTLQFCWQPRPAGEAPPPSSQPPAAGTE
jgi:type IV pilus assembly protein PilM